MSLFITFEGIEGAGKSTQIRLLEKALKVQKFSVVITREPGGSIIGNQIRKILLDPKNKKLTPLTELLLYEADRAQHVEEIITPALIEKKIVISDRYMDASTVYQGVARKLDDALVAKLNRIATRLLLPDLTIVLDCPPKEGFHRLKKRKLDRIEKEKLSFHEEIRRGYLELAKEFPRRVKVINGLQDPKRIHKQILNLIQAVIPVKK